MSKRFTDEIEDIRGSFNSLKDSFLNSDIYDEDDESNSEHYDHIDDDDDEATQSHNTVSLSDIKENVERRNAIFLALQTLFVLSFIHMDNFSFHIEGILGLVVLALSVYKKKFNYPAKGMNIYILGILCLDAVFNTGFKDLELMIATAFLMYEQYQVSDVLIENNSDDVQEYKYSLIKKSGVALLFMLVMWII